MWLWLCGCAIVCGQLRRWVLFCAVFGAGSYVRVRVAGSPGRAGGPRDSNVIVNFLDRE